MAGISKWPNFCTKIYEFLEAEPLNKMVQYVQYVVKVLLPVVKVQNGGCIQDGAENVYNVRSILIFFFISKLRNNLLFKMLYFKKFQDFIIAQPLNEKF
jgi:hypothetical protein